MLNMLKKTMKTKIPLQVMMPLTAAMVCSMLCGCGMENGDYGYENSAPAVSAAVPSSSIEHVGNEPASAAENPGERAEEMLESADNQAEDDSTDSEKPTGNSDSGSGNSTAGASYSTVRERYEAARNRMSGQTSGKTSEQESSGNAAADDNAMNSVSEVAKLADLKAPVQLDFNNCFVNVGEDSHKTRPV